MAPHHSMIPPFHSLSAVAIGHFSAFHLRLVTFGARIACGRHSPSGILKRGSSVVTPSGVIFPAIYALTSTLPTKAFGLEGSPSPHRDAHTPQPGGYDAQFSGHRKACTRGASVL